MTATLVLAPVITGMRVVITLVRAGSPSGNLALSGSSAANVYLPLQCMAHSPETSFCTILVRRQVELVALDAFLVAMLNQVLAEFQQRIRRDPPACSTSMGYAATEFQ